MIQAPGEFKFQKQTVSDDQDEHGPFPVPLTAALIFGTQKVWQN